MVRSYLCYSHFIACCSLFLILQVYAATACAQSPVNTLHAGIPDSIPIPKKDTLKKQLANTGNRLYKNVKDSLTNAVIVDINNPFKNLFITRPAFKVNGGMVSYAALQPPRSLHNKASGYPDRLKNKLLLVKLF